MIRIGIIIILVFILVDMSNRETFVAMVDGNPYKVLDRFSNYMDAADLLAKINRTNVAVIEHLRNKYHDKKGEYGHFVYDTLRRRYRPDRLIENDPPDKYSTSYTEDKGSVLALCLREKKSGSDNFEEFNDLIFVSMHELAHIFSTDYGHDDEFWANFKFLLNEAVDAGLYVNVDYSKRPINYCGLDVAYNPLFDRSLRMPV